MADYGPRESHYGLDRHGVVHTARIRWNLTTAQLYEEAVLRGEGMVGHRGPLVVETGRHTGRSPKDKFFVREPTSSELIDWGDVNVAIEPEVFDNLYSKAMAYLQHKEVFVQDLLAGADLRYQKKIRFINECAWHNLFVRSLFLRPTDAELAGFDPDITVVHVPNLYASPEVDGTRSETFVLCDFGRKIVLIGGTGYAGETKKSIFTALNYLLPAEGVLPMHCAANYGERGDCALFFGLSGTGKTSLSADPERTLIGDDEHGWSDYGVFNFEGGCYAKVIRLSQEAEPAIWAATHHFGTVLENVVISPITRDLLLDDDSLTENTRAAYPLRNVPNCDLSGQCGHPENIVFLTCDAFGVLPPVARLSVEQAVYHFLSGYTARVAGTEKGVEEPQATFSTCFGGPFMVLRPSVYAGLLGDKLRHHQTTCWLINTGWSGGPYGVGQRIKIRYTRAMVKAALNGSLLGGQWRRHPIFGLEAPVQVEGVPDELLEPRRTWSDGAAYDQQALKVSAMFRENFRQYEATVGPEVRAAGMGEGQA